MERVVLSTSLTES